jgi:DNA-binding XRE family transcriptional regulator
MGFRSRSERRDILMHIERITRKGREFAVIPVEQLQRLMEDAQMLADVKAYDAAKARLERGEDELVPLEITERRLVGEDPLKVWREHRGLTQEQLAKESGVSRVLIAAIETKRKGGSLATIKKLAKTLNVDWESLA